MRQRMDFLQPAVADHLVNTFVYAGVEILAAAVEKIDGNIPDAAGAFQFPLRKFATRASVNLQNPDNAVPVVFVGTFHRFGIHLPGLVAEPRESEFFAFRLQGLPYATVNGGNFRKPKHQRLQVKPCATHQDVILLRVRLKKCPDIVTEIPGGIDPARFAEVYQVVVYPLHLEHRRLCRANSEAPVYLAGIHTDDFGTVTLRKFKGKF